MYSDTVRQQNHPQVPTVHLIDFRPTANTTIFLHRFGLGKFNDTLDPFVLDYGTIRTVPEEFEVGCDFHEAFISRAELSRYWHLAWISVGNSSGSERFHPTNLLLEYL